ncbi:MAG: DUF4234 domain-containing protein [Elusimicrobia bacterium]|nr:DUF4234 domain-containing protein [Elusimicrobiota bacterium]
MEKMNKKWSLKIGDKTYPSLETEKIKLLLEKGKIDEAALIKDAGSADYGKISQTEEFKKYIKLRIGAGAPAIMAPARIADLIKTGSVPRTAHISQLSSPGKWYEIYKVKAFKAVFDSLRAEKKCPVCGEINTAAAHYCTVCKTELIKGSNKGLAISEDNVEHQVPGLGSSFDAGPAGGETGAEAGEHKGTGYPGDHSSPQGYGGAAGQTSPVKKYECEPFYYLPVSKVVILSILTLGIYELIWFYRQWSFVKERLKPGIKPFWRAVFGILYCDSLFKTVKKYADTKGIEAGFSADLLALAYILLSFSWKLPGYLSAIALLTCVPIALVQKGINRLAQDYVRESADTVMETRKGMKGALVPVIISLLVFGCIFTVSFIDEYKKFTRPVTSGSLAGKTLDDIGMSLLAPGDLEKNEMDIPSSEQENILRNINYSFNTMLMQVAVAYCEYNGLKGDLDLAYQGTIANLTGTGGIEDVVHEREYTSVSGKNGISYTVTCSMNGIDCRMRGLIVVGDSDIWSVSVVYGADDIETDKSARKIIESVKIL